MGSMVLGGLDVVGDMDGDMDGDMVLGAGGRHHGAKRVPTPRWMNATTSQGVSRPQEELDYLPFSFVTLQGPPAEGPGAAILAGTLIAQPQRPFRAERLIMGAIKNDGSDLGNAVLIDPAIYVGAVQVGAAQGSTPVSVFAANAFGVRLSMPAAGQGTLIKIFVRIPDGFLTDSTTTALISAPLSGRAMR